MFERTLKETTPLETPYVLFEGKNFLSFSTNDYLGLAHHPQVKQGAIDATHSYGTSSSSARTLAGTTPLHLQIEQLLATYTQREAALLFNTGYLANHGVISTLADKNTTLLIDRKSHRSIIEGALASKARIKRFHHNDLNHLEKLLQQTTGPTWIITESLFSMDGDLAPLQELIALKTKYNALLMVDEAHSFGLYGHQGGGFSQNLPVDIVVGILGKGLGSFGGFVATTEQIKKKLINHAPSFLYTTALPPSVLGATLAALTLLPSLDQERAHLKKLSALFNSETHIIPHIVGTIEETNQLSEYLKEQGILTFPIHAPTVPKGESMLRFSLTSKHTDGAVAFLNEMIQRKDAKTQRKKR